MINRGILLQYIFIGILLLAGLVVAIALGPIKYEPTVIYVKIIP